MTTRDVVRAYYEAWARRDEAAAAALMAKDFRLVSVWGVWGSAEEYLEEFGNLSDGITAIELLREVYDDDQAFVLFRVDMASGGGFVGTDLLRVRDGKVAELINVNSGDPTKLAELL